MPNLTESFPSLISALELQFGAPDRAEESSTPLERLIVRFWSRLVSKQNVPKALAALEQAGLLDPEALGNIDPIELRDVTREAGLDVPAKDLARFQRLVRALAEYPELWDDETASLDEPSTSTLRDDLVAISGIGPAVADDVLLNAFHRARYPVDRATYRILFRHGWIDSTADYEEIVELLVRLAESDPNLLSNLSLWFDEVGRIHCRAASPRCERCPLRPFLPDSGPIGDE